MRTDQKVDYVTQTLFPMLQNDLETILEARCGLHGMARSGGGANFSACLLCLIACEVAGLLSADRGMSKNQAIRRFIAFVGDQAGDQRYGEMAGPLFAFFRHGIAHTFLPAAHGGLYATLAWSEECPEWLASPDGKPRAAGLRQDRHLVIRTVAQIRTFQLVPQLLYLDVRGGLKAFGSSLQEGTFDVELFAENFDKWDRKNSRIEEHCMTAEERVRLGISPLVRRRAGL